MILGSLTISLNAIDILQPPHPPYNGLSVKEISQKLREMRVPQYCMEIRNYENSWPPSKRICEGIKGPLEAKIKELDQQLQGVELTAGNSVETVKANVKTALM